MSTQISYTEELKRKAVHLSSLWMVAATLLLPRLFGGNGRLIACVIFFALLLLTLFSEHDYANNGKYLGRLYGIIFGKMLREAPRPGQWVVSGGAPVLAAALLVNLIFPPVISAASLAVMLTGDAAAALVGRQLGKHKLVNGKSLEGTIAFVATGYLAAAAVFIISGVSGIFYLWAIPAVIAAAADELFTRQLKIDDNFTIPVCVGAVLMLGIFS